MGCPISVQATPIWNVCATDRLVLLLLRTSALQSAEAIPTKAALASGGANFLACVVTLVLVIQVLARV
jgi:hypothetical protein